MTKQVFSFILLSTLVAMGSADRDRRFFGITVPDFVTQTVANGMKTAASVIPGLDADEGVRAGCQAVGYYNTPKANAAKNSGGISAGFGALTGAWGQAFASEESKKKVCQDNGFYDPNPAPQNLAPVYVYDPPTYVYDPPTYVYDNNIPADVAF